MDITFSWWFDYGINIKDLKLVYLVLHEQNETHQKLT